MNKYKYNLLIAIIMASLSCFSPTFISVPNTAFKLILYTLLLLFFIQTLSARSVLNKEITVSIYLLTFCQIVSAYNAYAFNGQNIGVSLIATMQGIAYILLIPLSKSGIKIKQIEKIALIFTICYLVCSVLNRLSPYPLFGSADEDVDRGAVRFRVVGIFWAVFLFLMKINKYTIKRKRSDLYWIIAIGIGILFSLTRQTIVISFAFGGMLYFAKSKLTEKLLFVLCTVSAFYIILPHMTIANSLIEKTIADREAQQQYDNIRLIAARYYAFEYPRNTQQVLFGVGVPSFGKSEYGNKMENIQKVLKVYREDVGYCGFYFNYGIVATILLIVIFVRVLFLKIPDEYVYLKYFSGTFLLFNIASAPCQVNSGIIPYVLMLYLVALVRQEDFVKEQLIYGKGK